MSVFDPGLELFCVRFNEPPEVELIYMKAKIIAIPKRISLLTCWKF
jgi:hypothetical protein